MTKRRYHAASRKMPENVLYINFAHAKFQVDLPCHTLGTAVCQVTHDILIENMYLLK